MGFTFCINPPHNTIQPQRNRVRFDHNMFIIGLCGYLVAHDAFLSTVSSLVGATVTAIACSFQALFDYGSFITVYFAHIRILDFLLLALVAILFASGALLAWGAPKLVVASSFLALCASVSFDAFSHGCVFSFIAVMYITRIRAFVTFILFIGEVLALGAAIMAVFSSFLACIRCIYFGIVHRFIRLGCNYLVLDAICIVSPQRILCIAIGEAELAIYSSLSALGVSILILFVGLFILRAVISGFGSILLYSRGHILCIAICAAGIYYAWLFLATWTLSFCQRIFACNKLCFVLHYVVLLFCLNYKFS